MSNVQSKRSRGKRARTPERASLPVEDRISALMERLGRWRHPTGDELQVCPRCGGKVVAIIYGQDFTKDPELIARFERREAVSGGCLIPDDVPDRACTGECGTWYVDGEPSGISTPAGRTMGE